MDSISKIMGEVRDDHIGFLVEHSLKAYNSYHYSCTCAFASKMYKRDDRALRDFYQHLSDEFNLRLLELDEFSQLKKIKEQPSLVK